MIRAFDASLPSGMAKLPAELFIEIVRFAVRADRPIDIGNLEQERERLLAPFADLLRMHEVAAEEYFRMNTISLMLDEDQPEANSKAKPTAFCCFKLPLRAKLREIQHLQLRLNLVVGGGEFEHVDDAFNRSGDFWVVDMFRMLAVLFPGIRTLDVQIDNRGAEHLSSLHTPTVQDGDELEYRIDSLYHTLGCPHFATYKHMERLLKMQRMLMLVGAAHAPRLVKKTITFTQYAPSFSAPATIIKDHDFHAIRPSPDSDSTSFMDAIDRATAPEKARAGLLFCEILDRPKTSIEEGRDRPRIRDHFSKAELATMYTGDVGKTDRAFLEEVVKRARVVVQFARRS